jgi:3-methylcrotonyl-CoA carboxylase alpha subunit
MFKKILIANRGEIACRVIATARRLGITTVAVYSEADAQSRHVALADEAYPIGPAPARQSYLAIPAILDAAKRAGAQAIHPGYGFLSENAEFAEACAAAGIVFIGPPAAAIRAMGSKSAAKALMEKSGVPLVPGYHGESQDLATLATAAARIGYPVLLKASAGGGGKGMRVVETPDALQSALEGAKREAMASFGDDRMLVERYLTRPRHIEIQIFADSHGGCVSLFERDCSIQRRHQKVLEEAPAPGMHPARRLAMGDAAIAAARAVGYVGAGTVEFIAEGNAFYFMEMNTRLQVEHPVTEMITGQDLVEWQLRVAFGEHLPRTQGQLHITGHAIEARIYAEDPARDFLPSIGTLTHLHQPAETPNIRVDTGVRQGDAISPHYDPMIAKLIVWGEDRAAAVQHLSLALAEYEVVGVQTNLALLRAIAAHEAFGKAAFDTGFIGRHAEVLMPPEAAASPAVLAAAVLTMMDDPTPTLPSEDLWSPWNTPDAWRMNGDGYQDLVLRDGETVMTIRAQPGPDGVTLTLPTGRVLARAEPNGLRLDGVAHRLRVVRQGEAIIVIAHGSNHVLYPVDPLAPPAAALAGGGKVTAPIPGRVARILVAPGDAVLRGAALLVIEAMKMELTLTAPMDGVVATIRPVVDEMVQDGAELVTFVVDATPPA